jgi:MFS family permease
MARLFESVRGNLGVMILSSGIWMLAGQLVYPFQSLYILHLGGSYFHIGLITAIGAITGIFPTLIGGHLADTIGRKKMIYSMSFLLSLNALIFSLATNLWWLIFASIQYSFALGLRGPAFSSLIADSTKKDNRAQSYALWSIIPPIFGLASPYIMGVYMDQFGIIYMLRIGYIILFAASFISSTLRYFYIEETLTISETKKIGVNIILKDTLKGILETIRTLPRLLWILGIMGVFFGFGAAVGGPFWVTYATEDVIHLSLSQWGLIAASNTLISTIIGIPLAKIADKKGRIKLLIPSIVLTPISIIAFINSTAFTQTFVVSIIITILGSMGMSSGQALFTDLSDPTHRGRINALWSIAGTMQSFRIGVSPGSIMGATGSLLGGYLYQNLGKSLPLYVQSGMVFLAALTGLIYLKEPISLKNENRKTI